MNPVQYRRLQPYVCHRTRTASGNPVLDTKTPAKRQPQAQRARTKAARRPRLSMDDLRDEIRLLSAIIDDLRADIACQQEEAEINARDAARKAVADYQRENADWSFPLENGQLVHVLFDGPGARHPGRPRAGQPPGHRSDRSAQFFAALRAAAAKAVYPATS